MNVAPLLPRRFLALLSAGLLLAGAFVVGSAQPAGALPPSPFIVYVNTPDGGAANVWKMNPDCTGKVQLTTIGGDQPALSPDGSKIVFTSWGDWSEEYGSTEEIYVMNADGSGQTRLTNDGGRDVSPGWSPDGSKIIFTSDRTGNWQIWTIDPSGNNATRVVSTGTDETGAKFSPDGTKIVFISSRSGKGQVWTMNADGTSPFRVTQDGYYNDYPSWSPDGTRIAFTSERSPSGPDTYTIAPDGSSPSGALTSTFTQQPQWSPDSTRIVVQSPRNGNWDVYSMNADGTDQVRLTTDSGLDTTPFWGPGVPGYIVASPPAAPSALVATPGDGSASIAFTPGSDGGEPISKYQYKVGAGSWIDAVGTSSPLTISGLTNNATSRIRLRAVNTAGDGAASEQVSVYPRVTGPSLTSARAQGSTKIFTAFSAFGPVGATVSHYWVYAYAKGTTTAVSSARCVASARSCLVSGLTAGTEYDVAVRGFFTLSGSPTVLPSLDSNRRSVRTAS